MCEHGEHGLNMVLAQPDVRLKDISSRRQVAPASPKSTVFEKFYSSDQLVLHPHEQTGPARKQNPRARQTQSAWIM